MSAVHRVSRQYDALGLQSNIRTLPRPTHSSDLHLTRLLRSLQPPTTRRNSTDTAFFQRLRPYPRVLLRRCNTQFKVTHYTRLLLESANLATCFSYSCSLLHLLANRYCVVADTFVFPAAATATAACSHCLPPAQDYEKCAIGFGVVVFCIATASHQNCLQLYERFYAGFSAFGEPNIPIDTGTGGMCVKAYVCVCVFGGWFLGRGLVTVQQPHCSSFVSTHMSALCLCQPAPCLQSS